MRYTGTKKNRPEQKLAAALIQAHLPSWAIVEVEDLVQCFDADNPQIPKDISVDISVIIQQKKVAIELNGPPHDELPQMRRDSRKEIILEWKGNDWKYLAFDYNKMPTLFLRNRRKLSYDEAVKAYGEITTAAAGIIPLADANQKAIEAVLRKTQLS